MPVHFYLVDKLPEIPECHPPRDNSSVPVNAKVYEIACTLDDTTYFLKDSRIGYPALGPEAKRDVHFHEMLRLANVEISTSSIENITATLPWLLHS